MGLLGTLDTFALSDALRLLGATRKTGRLHVEGERRHGAVWLDDGALVEGTIDRRLGGESSLAEVIFEMLRLEEGSFRFVPDDPPPATNRQAEEIEVTLARATELLDEWRELAVTVPSLHHRVALAPELPSPQVTLDAGRWTTLVAVADGPTVLEVAKILGLGELEVARTIDDLVEVGVAVVQAPSRAAAVAAGLGPGPGPGPGPASGHPHTGEIALQPTIPSDPLPRTGETPAVTLPPGWQ